MQTPSRDTRAASRRTLWWLAGASLALYGLGGLLLAGLVAPTTVQAEIGGQDPVTQAYGATTSQFVIPYEGTIELDGQPLDGTVTLEFALYEIDPALLTLGTTPEWDEQHTVTAVDGRFAVGLGTTEAINQTLLDADRLYLVVRIDDGTGTFVDLGGIQTLEPAAYSLWTAHANDLHVAGRLTVGSDLTVGATLKTDTLEPADDTGTTVTFSTEATVESLTLPYDALVDVDPVGTAQATNLEASGVLAIGSVLELTSYDNRATLRSPTGVIIETDTDDTAANDDDIFVVAQGAEDPSVNRILRLQRDGDLTVAGALTVGDLLSANRIDLTGDLDIGGHITGMALDRDVSESVGSTFTTTDLGSSTNRICWLGGMYTRDIIENEEDSRCLVTTDPLPLNTTGNWKLYSFASSGTAECWAHCLALPLDQ